MDDTTQHIEVNGETYLIMDKRLFDLRIRYAYISGEIYAYRNIRDGKVVADTIKGDEQDGL